MLLSLSDVDEGTPLKTMLEQAFKAQRDAIRAPVPLEEFQEELSTRFVKIAASPDAQETPQNPQCSPSDEPLKIPSPNVESNKVLKEENDNINCGVGQMKSQESMKPEQRMVYPTSSLTRPLPDDDSTEGSVLGSSVAKLPEVTPTINSFVGDQNEPQPVVVSTPLTKTLVDEQVPVATAVGSEGDQRTPTVTLKLTVAAVSQEQKPALTPATMFRQLVAGKLTV